MECPICGSDDFDILNSKQKSSKKKITEEYLLKCVDCGHVFKNVVSSKKPQLYRVIISKQGESIKTFIEFSLMMNWLLEIVCLLKKVRLK